jgi:hypothetical protein
VPLRFIVVEGAADASHDLTLLVREGTDPPARGTGLVRAEVFRRLPLCGVFESASEQRMHGGHGDFFHLGEGDVGSRPLLAPVLPDDDFSPAMSKFMDAAKIL